MSPPAGGTALRLPLRPREATLGVTVLPAPPPSCPPLECSVPTRRWASSSQGHLNPQWPSLHSGLCRSRLAIGRVPEGPEHGPRPG